MSLKFRTTYYCQNKKYEQVLEKIYNTLCIELLSVFEIILSYFSQISTVLCIKSFQKGLGENSSKAQSVILQLEQKIL